MLQRRPRIQKKFSLAPILRFLKRFHPIKKFSNAVDKNIGNVVKVIAFLISLSIFGASLFGGYLLFTVDSMLKIVGLIIMIAGTVIAAITLFLIYALGHMICQNQAIIDKLNRFEVVD